MYITNTTINEDNSNTLEIAMVFLGMAVGFILVINCIRKLY